MARSVNFPKGFKCAPYWLVYCDTDWLSDTARELRDLLNEERQLRYDLGQHTYDGIHEIQAMLDTVKQIDKQVRDIGSTIIQLLELDKDPDIQKLRLRNPDGFITTNGEGEPWHIQVELVDKNKPGCSAKIMIQRTPGG